MGGALSSPKKGPPPADTSHASATTSSATRGDASSARYAATTAGGGGTGTSSATGNNNKGAAGLLLPSSRDEYFLSIVLVPGCEEAELKTTPSTADSTASSQTDKHAYWKSANRRPHLRWAVHRGVMHGCQPAMFWKTPFVGSNDEDEVTRYLSQFAHNFVFGAEAAANSSSKPSPSSSAERRVIIYLVSPNDEDGSQVLKTQVDRIMQLWKDTGRCRPDIKPMCVLMQSSDFDQSVLCLPPCTDVEEAEEEMSGDKSSPSGKTATENKDCAPRASSRDQTKQDEKAIETNYLSPQLLATVRGAGLLHGYPALVIDCSPTVIQCICTDARGEIIGDTTGFGLSVKLKELISSEAKASGTESPQEEEIIVGHDQFIRAVDASAEQIKRAIDNSLGDMKKEVIENARSIVSFWIYRLNQAASKGSQMKRLSEEGAAALDRLERIASALDKFYGEYTDSEESDGGNGIRGGLTRRTPVFRSLYDLNNTKKNIVLSGVDSELIGDLVNTHRKTPATTPAVQFNALEQDIGGEDGFLRFPWNDSPAATCWDGDEDEDEDVTYSARRAVHPILKNEYALPHFGVAASVMAHYIEGRYLINIIGTRVAKIFTDPNSTAKTPKRNIYRGRIAKVEQEGMDKEEYFFIMYDDGDCEHVSKKDLLRMIRLYTDVGEHGTIEDMEATEKKRSSKHADVDAEQPSAKRQRKKRQMPGYITHFD